VPLAIDDCVIFVVEGEEDLHRAEDLLLREAVLGREHRREGPGHVVAGLGGVGGDLTLGDALALPGKVEIALTISFWRAEMRGPRSRSVIAGAAILAR
jgi:hypothetical protein